MCANWCIFSATFVCLVFAQCLAVDDDFPLPAQCGLQSSEDKIIRGTFAGIDEFPWMALLKFRVGQSSGYGCGGALISKRYVLTAAHCVTGKFGPPIEVTLGEYNVDSPEDCITYPDHKECADPPQFIQVEDVVPHPEYVKHTPHKLHDIALIRLKTSAKYSDFVKPICIPTSQIQEDIFKAQGSSLGIAGWGRTLHRPASNIKRKAHVPIQDSSACSKHLPFKLASSQLCAGGGKQDSCHGDSGGPLMGVDGGDGEVRWYTTGIVASGAKICGTEGVPAVYTNVAFYRDWIVKSIKP